MFPGVEDPVEISLLAGVCSGFDTGRWQLPSFFNSGLWALSARGSQAVDGVVFVDQVTLLPGNSMQEGRNAFH